MKVLVQKLVLYTCLFFMSLGSYITFSYEVKIYSLLGFEISVYSLVPMISVMSSDQKLGNEMRVYYMLMQLSGSLIFAVGFMMSMNKMMCLAILWKLGLPPFFWWVNKMTPHLDWYSLGGLFTLQKVSGFMMMVWQLKMNPIFVLYFGLLVFFWGAVGLNYFCKSKLKLFVMWYSMCKMGVVMMMISYDSVLSLVYAVTYILSLGWLCHGMAEKKMKMVGFSLIMMTGIPFAVGYLLKAGYFWYFFGFTLSNQLLHMIAAFMLIQIMGFLKPYTEIRILKDMNLNKAIWESFLFSMALSYYLIILV